jgi:glutamate-5-semialdehyde dehydrogenase
MDVTSYVLEKAQAAKAASRAMAGIPTKVKNDALNAMATVLIEHADRIKEENAKDVETAKAHGLSSAMVDRLTLTDKRIRGMADGLREIALLPDPVGSVEGMRRRPNGLRIGKLRVPIGVIGFIYESRPNVTADAVGLCLKAGNAVVLRGGSEAIRSNICLAHLLTDAADDVGIPREAISIIETTDREAVTAMLSAEGVIDVVIPRGGEELIRAVVEHSRIPVIKHYKGVCHVYVDADADLDMAETIACNAKVQRPGVCNAMETLLVHKDVAGTFLPRVAERLTEAGVELRGCEETRRIIPGVKEAVKDDWYAEYLDLILAIRVVDSLDAAIEHIAIYGSAHTDAIVTRDYFAAQRFVTMVDSSSVMVNASTRFSDGGEYGLGAEVGISTDKLHARGPMGIEELTTYKWVVYGEGQVRE